MVDRGFRGTMILVLKVLFSIWIVYQIFVMILMPNGGSYPGRTLASWIRPYAAVIGLNTSWNFFSPDPAHTMFLKVTIFYEAEDGQEEREPLEIYLPDEKDEGVLDLARRRDLYSTRYMILDQKRIDAILGPWLCRKYEGASSLKIELVINSIPTLDEAVLFQERTLRDMGHEYDAINKDYRCAQVNDEVAL